MTTLRLSDDKRPTTYFNGEDGMLEFREEGTKLIVAEFNCTFDEYSTTWCRRLRDAWVSGRLNALQIEDLCSDAESATGRTYLLGKLDKFLNP